LRLVAANTTTASPAAAGGGTETLHRIENAIAQKAFLRAAETDAKLKRIYDAIENGVADLADPMLKDRVAELKSIPDQAHADAERAEGALERPQFLKTLHDLALPPSKHAIRITDLDFALWNESIAQHDANVLRGCARVILLGHTINRDFAAFLSILGDSNDNDRVFRPRRGQALSEPVSGRCRQGAYQGTTAHRAVAGAARIADGLPGALLRAQR